MVLRAGVKWSRFGFTPRAFLAVSGKAPSYEVGWDGQYDVRVRFTCRDCLSGIIWENRSAINLVGAWILIVYFE